MISNSLSTSEKFAALTTSVPDLYEFCHALYPLLVSHTDDFGRLQGDAFTVRAKCYPASNRTLEEFTVGLQALNDVGLVVWYLVGGKRFIQIMDFDKHQQGLHKRTRSSFPRVPGISGNDEEIPGQEKGTEENRTEELKGREPNRTADRFARFWAAYPNKVGKDAARKAFAKRNPDEALLAVMLSAIETQRCSLSWVKNGGQFIPHPTTWLNQGRWEDEAHTGTRLISDTTAYNIAASEEAEQIILENERRRTSGHRR